jgi:hypothetical protein
VLGSYQKLEQTPLTVMGVVFLGFHNHDSIKIKEHNQVGYTTKCFNFFEKGKKKTQP